MRRWLAALPLALLLTGQQSVSPPVQPVPYSHKQHIALGLKCAGCHTNPDPGDFMGIPAESKCMTCHRTVKADSPHIKKVAQYAAENRRLPWVRIYEIPSYVFFSHRAHAEAGAKCETCHGPVAQRDALWKETDISMGACMDCHRREKAPNDCNYCHEPLG